jgi:hypothetical protein
MARKTTLSHGEGVEAGRIRFAHGALTALRPTARLLGHRSSNRLGVTAQGVRGQLRAAAEPCSALATSTFGVSPPSPLRAVCRDHDRRGPSRAVSYSSRAPQAARSRGCRGVTGSYADWSNAAAPTWGTRHRWVSEGVITLPASHRLRRPLTVERNGEVAVGPGRLVPGAACKVRDPRAQIGWTYRALIAPSLQRLRDQLPLGGADRSAAADTEAADAPAPPPGIGSAGHSLIAAPSGLGARVVRMPAGQRLEQNRALVRSPGAGWLLWPLVTARDASDDVSHLNGARLLTHAPRQRELLARQGASRPVVVSADAASAGFAPVADNLARAPRGASPSLGIAAGSTPSRP